VKPGVVVGHVWATRRHPALAGRKMLLVAVQGAAGPTGEVVLAFDAVDAGVGERVLVSEGSGARRAFAPGDDRRLLVDAAVTIVREDEPREAIHVPG
jgi:ethanolamine utilization protein EutN